MPSSGGVSIHVHDLGGSGAPLLISHATGFCGRAYEPLARELSTRFHVYALDYRAHGDSSAPGADLSWERMTDDLEAAVRALSDEPVSIVGHSMGGACAMRLEARRPGSLRWAYLYEPIVLPADFVRAEPSQLPAGAARRRPSFPSRAEALRRYASRPPLDVLRADSLYAYVEHGFRDEADGSVTLKCAPADEAAVFGNTGAITDDDLATVQVPVTIAAGAIEPGGAFSPAALAEGQAAALPHGRLELHPTLGHFGPLQDPSGIAAAIVAAATG